MSAPQKRYWFPAKRYGWGWGFPTCWQGGVVFAVYFALIAGGVALLRGEAHAAKFIGLVAMSTLGLLAVCWWKGEPPRWRWGGD